MEITTGNRVMPCGVKKNKPYPMSREETRLAVAEGKEIAYNDKVKGYSSIKDLRAALEK